VQGAGCRVQGAGCRVQGAGCRVQGAGCRVPSNRCCLVADENASPFLILDEQSRAGAVSA